MPGGRKTYSFEGFALLEMSRTFTGKPVATSEKMKRTILTSRGRIYGIEVTSHLAFRSPGVVASGDRFLIHVSS